ncbi:hypothetical protein ACJ5NV_08675 [Loktanella agnita]|uniref:hypothetical protein n=1 Tax=Loktanella agnita TaxID=287097 RepID=UPI0039860DBD
MIETTEQGPTDSDFAAMRIAELSRLFETTRQALEHKIQTFGTQGGAVCPKAIVTQFNELRIAHLTVLAAEEAFHNENTTDQTIESADLDALRAEIGRKFDRIRSVLDPESVSGRVESGPTAGPALSV